MARKPPLKPKHIVLPDSPRLLRPAGSGHYNPESDPESHKRKVAHQEGDHPNLLDHDVDHGYTSSPHLAMRGEPEAIRGDDQTRESLKARLHDNLRRRRDVERKLTAEREQLEQQLGSLRDIARTQDIDVDSDLRVVKRRLDAIECKIRKAAA